MTITDAKLGDLTCVQPATLAPGATLACTASWTITQAEIDAGQVDNTGTADSVETPPVSTPRTVVLPQVTSLSLVKTVQQVGYTTAGDPLDYGYRVTNTGNTSLAGLVTVNDTKTGVTCPAVTSVGDNDGALDPGEVLDCTATYAVTAADVTAGRSPTPPRLRPAEQLSSVDLVTVDKLSVVADLAVTKRTSGCQTLRRRESADVDGARDEQRAEPGRRRLGRGHRAGRARRRDVDVHRDDRDRNYERGGWCGECDLDDGQPRERCRRDLQPSHRHRQPGHGRDALEHGHRDDAARHPRSEAGKQRRDRRQRGRRRRWPSGDRDRAGRRRPSRRARP